MSIILDVKNLAKIFGKQQVFSGLNFDLEQSKITVIRGKSGIGKTTFLNCLTGLSKPDQGQINSSGKIGMVFQDFYLWDNKKVIDNIIEAPIFVDKIPKDVATNKAKTIIEKLHLNLDILEKYPPELSRGQRQRVAIARTLAMDPDIIILDEPTASLDELLVGQVIGIIKKLQSEGKTVLIISHDSNFVERVGEVIYNFEDLLK